MNNKKKKSFIIGSIVLLALVVYFSMKIYHTYFSHNGGIALGFPLQAIRLAQKNVTITKELPGRTTAYKVAEIRPQVSGIITERLFTEGSYVEEGQQLYQINPASYKAAYESALANVKKAEAHIKSIKSKNLRYEELVKIDAISKQEYEDIQANVAHAEANLAIAEAALAQAKINLDYTKVYAPISGRIGKSNVSQGALVTGGQQNVLATITVLDPIYVDITQSSSDLLNLNDYMKDYKNITINIFFEGKNEKYNHEGKLQFHEVNIDQSTNSIQLRGLFPNPDNVLLPGLFVRTKLSITLPEVLLIPHSATVRQPDGTLSAWKVDQNDIVSPININTNGSTEGNWIVTSGVKEGDIIITEGLIKLRPGMKVSPLIKEENTSTTTVNTQKTE